MERRIGEFTLPVIDRNKLGETPRMNIMFICDTGYASLMTVMVAQLYRLHPGFDLHIYVVHHNMSEERMQELNRYAEQENWTFHFIYGEVSKFDGLKVIDRYPSYLYYKLVPHLILPEELDRVMFLDIDMAVTEDLVDMYFQDMNGCYLAAAWDGNSFRRHLEGRSMKGETIDYANSGAMVIDLQKFREANITVQDYKDALTFKQTLFEEQLMNTLLLGKIKPMYPFDYNFTMYHSAFFSEAAEQLGIDKQLRIIHFMDNRPHSIIQKPWEAYDIFENDQPNTIFSDEMYGYYKAWWDIAKQSPNYDVVLRELKEKDQKDAARPLLLKKLAQVSKDKVRFSDQFGFETLYAPYVNSIPKRASLNNYTIPGSYRCPDAETKRTLFGLPIDFTDDSGFRLTVKQIAIYSPEAATLIQTIEPNLPNAPLYRRYYYGKSKNRWGPWHRMMTNIDLEKRLNNKDLEITGDPDASISILGICVLRDIFGMRENDGGYRIERNVSFINPITMMGQASTCDHEQLRSQVDQLEDNNFVKRNIYLDLTKKYWEYLAEVKSDYLMIDVADIRLPMMLDQNGCPATCRFQNKPLMEQLAAQDVYPIAQERGIGDYTDEEIQAAMEFLASKVQELYPQNQIILAECIPSEHYYNAQQNIQRFDVVRDVVRCKNIVQKAYAIIRKLLPDAHVIPMPKYIMADAKHKWNLYMLHYEKAYYDYAYHAVRIITSKLPNKKEKIRRLKSAVEDGAMRRLTEKMIDRFGSAEDFFVQMHVDSLMVPTWASIKAYENLDQYLAPATYRCVDGATKATLKMLPEKFTENVGFRLTVKNISANGACSEETSCIQILEPNYPNCAIYRRYHYGGKYSKWGPWIRLSTDADLEALTQTSTAQAEQITQLNEQLSAQTKANAEQAEQITQLNEQLATMQNEMAAQKKLLEALAKVVLR